MLTAETCRIGQAFRVLSGVVGAATVPKSPGPELFRGGGQRTENLASLVSSVATQRHRRLAEVTPARLREGVVDSQRKGGGKVPDLST